MAVLATIQSGRDVVFASVHRDGLDHPGERAAQIDALRDAIESHSGGDQNTFSLDPTDVGDAALNETTLRGGPRRPEPSRPHEPLFEAAANRGDVRTPATRAPSPRRLSGRYEDRLVHSLGLRASQPAVLCGADADGVALSGHGPIAGAFRCRAS